ncbi:hypothetical protein MD484_g7517, partial [Candolleomyces efflorescens]
MNASFMESAQHARSPSPVTMNASFMESAQHARSPSPVTMNASFMESAQQVAIENLQFNNHQTNIIPSPDLDPALLILHKNRAIEASHTSKTAESAPKCKDGTRVSAITDLTTWADKAQVPAPDSFGTPVESVLLLRGPAGAGKTCILREVTARCHMKETLLGDYFFSTRVQGLDDETPFVATLASHLIKAIPACRGPVLMTIRSDPTIFEQSLEYQVQNLISNHITSIPPESRTPHIIVIDGFDECREPKQRANLLRIIHRLVTPPNSFRVIIGSRPEFDIRTAFKQPPFTSITKIVHLESYETSGEIYQYLVDEFARIRETHPAKDSIPSQWPGQDTLEGLKVKSARIWAYPSTVIKYVDNPRRHPVERLKHVLDASSKAYASSKASSSSKKPFAELDALYKVILNPPDTDIQLMKRLLHFLVELPRQPSLLHYFPSLSSFLSPSFLDRFLSLERGTTEITLCDLHSVLSLTDPDQPHIHFHHKSLEDYLYSSERSDKLYQSQEDTQADLMNICIHHLQHWNRKLVEPNANFKEIDDILWASCRLWEILLIHRNRLPPSILDFDSRIVWRCFAFVSFSLDLSVDHYKRTVNLIHNPIVCRINLFYQLSRAHTCFFHRLVQREGGMLSALRLAQAYD